MSADDASQKLTGGTIVFPKLKELRLASLHCSDQTVAAILAQCTQLRTMVRSNAHVHVMMDVDVAVLANSVGARSTWMTWAV
jgi:hypothetical protein